MLVYGERKYTLPTEEIAFFLLNQQNIMHAAQAMLKVYNSAEQSVNLPARDVASRGGSLFLCALALAMNEYTSTTWQALLKDCRHHSNCAACMRHNNDL